VAVTKHKGKKAPTEGTLDHFKKLLEGPCSNHAYTIKHQYKECALMKQFLSEGSNKGDQKKKSDLPEDDTEEREDVFWR
jgi:hypothetical protein